MNDLKKTADTLFKSINLLIDEAGSLHSTIDIKKSEIEKEKLIIKEKVKNFEIEELKLADQRRLIDKEKQLNQEKQEYLEAREKRLNEKIARINRLSQEEML